MNLNRLSLSKPILLLFARFACDVWWTSTSNVLVAQDGIVDPLDSTLRDFSATCIQEFVKWSIKQTTPKQQEKSPANIKSLFKRIYSLALHPNIFKRLGAALAFNSMYRNFRSVCVFCLNQIQNLAEVNVYPNTIVFLREESSLVEQFVFEVLVVFVESLSLAHCDEKSLGNKHSCQKNCDMMFISVIKHVIFLLSTQELFNSAVVPWTI